MAFASPGLVATLALMSPQIRALPDAVRRRIAEAGDVPGPGRYRVVGVTSYLNVHDAGTTTSHVNGTLKNGELVTSDGTVDNGFAFIQADSGPTGWVSVAYLAPEAAALPAPVAIVSALQSTAAPVGPELPEGDYVVATQTDPLNLRPAPSMNAAPIGAVPKGETVHATGQNQNYFSEVHYGGQTGWVASHYLASALVQGGSGLTMTASDVLQLRTMLAAWSNATAGAPSYGSIADMASTDAAMARQGEVVSAFQKWSNANRGTNLRTDGIVDQATRDALTDWGAATVGAAPASPTGLPTIPPAQPVADGTSDTSTATKAAGGAGLLLLVGLGLAAFLLLEEKKKKRATA